MDSPTQPQPPSPPPAEESDYESDQSDAPLRRRAAASDDEGSADESPGVKSPAVEEDLDGQGAAEVYDEDYVDDEEEIYDEYPDRAVNEYSEVAVIKAREVESGVEGVMEGDDIGVAQEATKDGPGEQEGDGVGEGGKKGSEPYAVPTSGAFYMHDDRFNENGRGRGQRRMFGGRKLWNPRDERAWVHDRFDEYQEPQYDDNRRKPRGGRFRGRGGGRSRGVGRGYYGGNRPRNYYEDNRNHNPVQKSVRGRGNKRYQPRWKNVSETSSAQTNKLLKAPETPSVSNVGKYSSQAPNAQSEPTPKKQINSNLNYASPPFYPSGSSHQEFSVVQGRDSLTSVGRVPDGLSMPMSIPISREKASPASVGYDGIYVDNGLHTASARPAPLAIHSSGSSAYNNSGLPSISRNQTRVAAGGVSMQDQFSPAPQSLRVSTHAQTPSVQSRAVQTSDPSAQALSSQMHGLQISGHNPIHSPSHSTAVGSAEDRESDLSPVSNKSKAQLSGSRKTNSQVAEMGSFLYGGTLGTSRGMGIALGDQSFAGTPALLSVMPFSTQNTGGPVPALGMALPGYVAPQQLGLGNSEMTWLPVLAGAPGSLGGTYPYITLDGNFYARSSGQAMSSATSRETNNGKTSSSLQLQQLPAEVMNDDIGQRQNKHRRYSEMNFGQ